MRRRRILAWWSDFLYKRRWSVIAISLAVTVIAGLWIKDMPVDTSFFAMLNPEDRVVRLFKSIIDEFGATSKVVLTVKAPDMDKARAFAEHIGPMIAGLPGVREVDVKAPLDFIEDYGLLMAPLKDLEKAPGVLRENRDFIRGIFENPSLASLLENINAQLRKSLAKGGVESNDSTMEMSNGLAALIRSATAYAREGRKAGSKIIDEAVVSAFLPNDNKDIPAEALGDGFIVSPDGSLLAINIRMNVDAFNMEFGMEDYKRMMGVVNDELPKWEGVEAGFAGVVAMGYEDQNFVLARVLKLSSLTFVIMVFIFWYMSRSLWSPLFVGLCLVMGIIWTFAVVRMSIGFINSMSLSFAILLFGLGIDFAIHIMTRHNEGLHDGLPPQDSLRNAISGGGVGIITGALTTALAFLAMNVADFRGAHQLGTTTGAGILCCLAIMMSTFPAFVATTGLGKTPIIPSQESPHLAAWARIVTRRPVVTLIVCAVITAAVGYFATRLTMVYDLEKIIARDIPAIKVKKELEQKFGVSMDYAMLIADDLDEARRYAREARKDPTFKRVDSVTDFLPEDQDKKLPILDEIRSEMAGISFGKPGAGIGDAEWNSARKEAASLEAVLRDLILLAELAGEDDAQKALTELRDETKKLISAMDAPSSREGLGYFQELLGSRLERVYDMLSKAGAAGPITLRKIPMSIRSMFVGTRGHYMVTAYPAGSLLQKENIERVLKAVRRITPTSTGMMEMVKMTVMQAKEDFPKIVAAVFASLFILLMLDFRSLKLTLLAVAPVLTASFIGLGIMYLSGQMVSVMTLIAFPLIFGIGIDYAVHILHRYNEEKDVVAAVSRTGRAIGYTSITTIIGFGILMFTNHNGLIGVGFLITVGVTLCFIASITIVPAALAISMKKK